MAVGVGEAVVSLPESLPHALRPTTIEVRAISLRSRATNVTSLDVISIESP